MSDNDTFMVKLKHNSKLNQIKTNDHRTLTIFLLWFFRYNQERHNLHRSKAVLQDNYRGMISLKRLCKAKMWEMFPSWFQSPHQFCLFRYMQNEAVYIVLNFQGYLLDLNYHCFLFIKTEWIFQISLGGLFSKIVGIAHIFRNCLYRQKPQLFWAQIITN